VTHAAVEGSPSWLRLIDRGHLVEELGRTTVDRGEAYHRQGRVTQYVTSHDGEVVIAQVDGSRSSPYTVTVRRDAEDGDPDTFDWYGHCTCPIGLDCKHIVAVILAAQADLAPLPAPLERAAAWEAAFDPILRPANDSTDPQRGGPLGLLVQVTTARPRAGRPAPPVGLTLRPVAPGANGGWIRTGIGWHDLEYGRVARAARADHREALKAIAAWQRSRTSYAYSTAQTIDAGRLGTHLWRLLEDAVAVGVHIVTGDRGQLPVHVLTDPVEVTLDLSRASKADLTVRATVPLAAPGSSMGLLGEPVHGAFAHGRDGLVLARFESPLAPALTTLVRGNDIHIPAADVDRFLTRYYPALRQHAAVRSSDGSIELPEVLPPRLALRLTARPDHGLAMRWTFRYAVGDGTIDVPLLWNAAPVDPRGAEITRDTAAEEALLGSLEVLDAVPGLRIPKPGLSRLAVVLEPELTGMQTVRFIRDVLPTLEQREDIDVTVVGQLLDYAETVDSPVISVSALDPTDDLFSAGAHPADRDAGSQLDWFDLAIEVTIAGHPVPLARLLAALAAGDEHLILDNGTWFALDRPELDALRRIVEESRSLHDHEATSLRINRFQAGLWSELVELGVVARQSERWSRSVGALLALETLPHPELPSSVKAELRDYQLDGYHWLSLLWDHDLGGILADDMGLGKTLQTLAMAERAREQGSLTADAPLLVVAPTSVVSAWLREAARFTPDLCVAALTETERRRGTSVRQATTGAHLVVTSYALFRIDEEGFRAQPWRGLVLDEAQFVKNHNARTYAAARRLPAPFKLAITGTPLENSLMDLWSLLSISAPGLFPSPQRFGELFRKPIESGTSPELLATLRRRIRPLMLRRTKESVAQDLPPKIEQVVPVTLNPQHRRIYDRHLHRERQRILGLLDDVDRNRIAILSALTKLRQLSLDVHLVETEASPRIRSSKVDALLDQLVEVVAEGHRCLVFSQFTSFLSIVRKRLSDEGIEHVYLDGRTRDRPKRIASFVDGTAPVFVISLKAGGSGLTLTEADYVFVLDPWWNPAVEAQAIDRAHRIGQDKTVMVYRLVSEGTIEEKVLDLQQRKRDLFARVVDDGGLMAAPLSAEDIRGLLGSPT